MKTEIKNYLIISFVIIEILSMIFNFYFIKIPIGSGELNVNFSVVFFCLGFFIVDIVTDKFSPKEAKQFVFYKFFSQIIFIAFGNLAISIYGLETTQLATIMDKSWWMLAASFIATVFGYGLMRSLMSYMKMGIYQGTSTFKRYLCSTIPGELVFSIIFTSLCFYQYDSFNEVLDIFLASALVKILLSICFAGIISLLDMITLSNKYLKKTLVTTEIHQTL